MSFSVHKCETYSCIFRTKLKGKYYMLTEKITIRLLKIYLVQYKFYRSG